MRLGRIAYSTNTLRTVAPALKRYSSNITAINKACKSSFGSLIITDIRKIRHNKGTAMRQIVDCLFDQFNISIQNLRPPCPQYYIVLGTYRQYVSIVFNAWAFQEVLVKSSLQ